jgi:hypothetical protein
MVGADKINYLKFFDMFDYFSLTHDAFIIHFIIFFYLFYLFSFSIFLVYKFIIFQFHLMQIL